MSSQSYVLCQKPLANAGHGWNDPFFESAGTIDSQMQINCQPIDNLAADGLIASDRARQSQRLYRFPSAVSRKGHSVYEFPQRLSHDLSLRRPAQRHTESTVLLASLRFFYPDELTSNWPPVG
jgi:hypothetical protein